MNRRKFLKRSAIASSGLMVPAFLKSYTSKMEATRAGKILVVIQLSGGNDGLNTIIPYQDDIYYQSRPTISIDQKKVLKVSNQLGFNPSLAALRNIYDNGEMTILNSVGYPNPDRSHFRSMDIWQTASGSDQYLSTGWLGRYLDSNCAGCDVPYHAIEVDDKVSLALKGSQRSAFAMSKPAQLNRTSRSPFHLALSKEHHHDHDEVAYLYKTMISTQSSAAYLFEQSKLYQSKVNYPKSSIAKDLKQVAELITADTDTKIYYVSLSGFDTHNFQEKKQNSLLEKYSEAVAAFVKDLKKNNLFDDTLIMTFSEFGRRVKQNASNGTDHGTANNVFLMSGSLKSAGFYNDAPNLSNLLNGDLQYEIDFRSIYASILDRWLGSNAGNILGMQPKQLNLV